MKRYFKISLIIRRIIKEKKLWGFKCNSYQVNERFDVIILYYILYMYSYLKPVS